MEAVSALKLPVPGPNSTISSLAGVGSVALSVGVSVWVQAKRLMSSIGNSVKWGVLPRCPRLAGNLAEACLPYKPMPSQT